MSDSGDAAGPDDYLLKVDNPLVVPVGRKIRIITTANDVIHAWMVPAFGVKQDAIPGFVRDTWFRAEKTGDFYGQCAELCGKEHAYMPIHVKVVSAQDYTAWVAERERRRQLPSSTTPSKVWTLDDMMARGEKVYAANCAACHQASGKGAGPIKPLDGSAIVKDQTSAPDRRSCCTAQNNGAMPAWKQLSDTDLAAVITYTKNSWSNKTGQLVQPADVVARASNAASRTVMSARKGPTHERSSRPSARRRHAHHDDHHAMPHTAGAAGSMRPTTRTSARCTCCSLHHADGRRHAGADDPCRAVPARPAARQPRAVQPVHHHARPDHGVRRHHAGLRGLRELDDPAADRRARHGLRAHEQLQLLAADPGCASCWWARSSCPAARPAAGWTLYAPLTLQMGPSMDAGIFAMHILGASSIMGSINIIVTILNMRAPGMTLMKMPCSAGPG
jgi:mono/diheme cytochrome c family protein